MKFEVQPRWKELDQNLEKAERERTGIKSLKVGFNKVFITEVASESDLFPRITRQTSWPMPNGLSHLN